MAAPRLSRIAPARLRASTSIGGTREKRYDERNRLEWKSLWMAYRPKKLSNPQAMRNA